MSERSGAERGLWKRSIRATNNLTLYYSTQFVFAPFFARRSLLAFSDGKATPFGLAGAQDRGKMFASAGVEVYKGMIVGVHQRPGDLEVNIVKAKALTNMRSAGKDNYVGITTALELTLDSAVEYIAQDEILEVTPTLLRMAKNPAKSKKAMAAAAKKN